MSPDNFPVGYGHKGIVFIFILYNSDGSHILEPFVYFVLGLYLPMIL